MIRNVYFEMLILRKAHVDIISLSKVSSNSISKMLDWKIVNISRMINGWKVEIRRFPNTFSDGNILKVWKLGVCNNYGLWAIKNFELLKIFQAVG